MATMSAVPGATVVVQIQVRKTDGTLYDLTGSVVETELVSSGVDAESVGSVVAVDDETRYLVVSGVQTEAAAGKQVRLRYWITPSDSFECVGGEDIINVKAA